MTRAGVILCVYLFTLSNVNISTTSRPIPTEYYLRHHWNWRKAALDFESDRIGTLVSMATDSSQGLCIVMGENRVSTRFSFLQVTKTTIKAWTSLNFCRIPPLTSKLAALERLKNDVSDFFSPKKHQFPSKIFFFFFKCILSVFLII